MKKLVSFSLFAILVLTMVAVHSAQAQAVVVRAGVPAPMVMAGGPGVYGPGWGRGYRCGPRFRPAMGFYGRPRFYRRPGFGVRARVW